MASVMPRSLNEAVGFMPSNLRNTRAPTRSDRRGAGSSGVPPSNSVTTGVSGPTGRNSRCSSMTPRHAAIALLGPDDAHEAADPLDDGQLAQVVQRRLHRALERRVEH